ncbi:hypothetical protein SEA_SEMPERFI_78 [Mycobacterium phage SemperFi]|uniref:Uncharacterized protein n=1 Tax=Mycobacterium phage Georgie2 TaxID=2743928 RepID=A0A7D5FK00_9CAUD|nr:hypothetical protein PBI_SWEETIEPIE_78 [Mycobacterium phage SweetiePie]YP_010063886.1 hypothetical protein KIY84_gp79 [Mycobacterium phage Georgie2]AXQ53004.1 hypothetical protein SEA_QUEENBEESLY_78 [Mycobacterium phage QueenBeesly]QFG11877.1 hypothetical protein SEA_SEMPERFI_78 [Mycobacterium phage SemperFi]QKY80143.1 hypothetical protein SEA_FIRINGLINE_78 [Mycobacterium Phage FiringLine]AIT13552.1 hypothetical protein PBI_SWEETIEPIE_78 [Mycobacterium phage SweetiePie]QLF82824.1 hypotheti
MAQDHKITKYNVRPLEENNELTGLAIQRTERWERRADNGRVLDYGTTVNVGDPLEVPASKVADLVRELVDWPIYFATGAAAREG